MNKVYDELKYAESLIKNGFSKYMSRFDLSILAKYYKYLGNSQPAIKKQLILFCEKNERNFNTDLVQ